MIEKILGNSAYWIVNKELARAVGINGALVLADLIDKRQYFEVKGGIDNEGYFFNTSEQIEANTTLSYHLQKQALKELINIGFVETKLKGVPAKLHFKIVENKILKFLNTSIEKNQKQDLENFETNKNINNNNKLDNNKNGKLPFPEPPKKNIEVFSNEVNAYYNKILNFFPPQLHPNEKQKTKWQDVLDKLNRIDGIPFETIEEIVKWAREDIFWSSNFLSLLKLRKTNKDGVKYIIVFNEGMNKNKPAKVSREDLINSQQEAKTFLNL